MPSMKRRSLASDASSSTNDAVVSSISRRSAEDDAGRIARPSALLTKDLLRPTIERCTENGLKGCVLSRITTEPSSKTPKSLGHDTCSSKLNIAASAAQIDRAREDT